MRTYSVTEILGAYSDFSGIDPGVLQVAAERGTRVHAACAAYAETGWQRPVEGDIAGYVESFVRWYDATVDGLVTCEMRLVHPVYHYHGTPDFCVVLRGEAGAVLVDLKTPAVESPTWRGQVAAYAQLIESNLDIEVVRTMALQPKKDGSRAKATVYRHTADDFNAFLCALSARRYFEKGAA